MTKMLEIEPLFGKSARLATLFVVQCVTSRVALAQSTTITITLTGQSMIRSDVRATAPAAVPAIQGLLKGDSDNRSLGVLHE